MIFNFPFSFPIFLFSLNMKFTPNTLSTMNGSENRVILNIQTYQQIFDRIKELESSNCQQEILLLHREIKDLETQKKVLLDQISAQEKWHNLFFYEHTLRLKYEKTLKRVYVLSLYNRVFMYKKIINSVLKNYALFSNRI